MYDFNKMFPDYDVDPNGNVYKKGTIIRPFKSNKYLQVLLYDRNHRRCVFGVHTVVAMKYKPDFNSGCIVHHIDGNTHNNKVENLKVMSQSEHARLHAIGQTCLVDYVKKYGPSNKGKKMSKEFCKKCSISAKLRGFNGNQFIDKLGNRR